MDSIISLLQDLNIQDLNIKENKQDIDILINEFKNIKIDETEVELLKNEFKKIDKIENINTIICIFFKILSKKEKCLLENMSPIPKWIN